MYACCERNATHTGVNPKISRSFLSWLVFDVECTRVKISSRAQREGSDPGDLETLLTHLDDGCKDYPNSALVGSTSPKLVLLVWPREFCDFPINLRAEWEIGESMEGDKIVSTHRSKRKSIVVAACLLCLHFFWLHSKEKGSR